MDQLMVAFDLCNKIETFISMLYVVIIVIKEIFNSAWCETILQYNQAQEITYQ
jgi:hypothetical protein